MIVKPSGRTRCPFLVASLLAVLAFASHAVAQELYPGKSSVRSEAASTVPVVDPLTDTVTLHASGGDDTPQFLQAFGVGTASEVGCTIRLTPGVYTARRLDVVPALVQFAR